MPRCCAVAKTAAIWSANQRCMTIRTENRRPRRKRLPGIARIGLSLIPLPLVQPLLDSIAACIAKSQPALFRRLGPNVTKRYLIDPTDTPFVLTIVPDPVMPSLITIVRRRVRTEYDVRIAGTFLELLAIIDGSADGDALFFHRGLNVSGDTEAAVALRNALESYEGRLIEDAVRGLGEPVSRLTTWLLSASSRRRENRYHG